MKHVIWTVYISLCVLVFGLPLFRTAHTGKVAGLPDVCPAGYAYDVTYGVCLPVEPPSIATPSAAALCDDGRILQGRSECAANTLAWFDCPAGSQIHVEEKPLSRGLTATPVSPIGKYGKRYVWCGMKYEPNDVYSGGKLHAN